MHKRQQTQEVLKKFTNVHVRCSIRNFHDAQDVIQDCFVLYFEMSKRYKNIPEDDFIKIAKTACRNKVRDYIRGMVSKRNLTQRLRSVGGQAEISLDRIDARLTINKLKNRASEELRSVLELMEKGLEVQDIKLLYGNDFSKLRVEIKKLVTKEEIANAVHSCRVSREVGRKYNDISFDDSFVWDGFTEVGNDKLFSLQAVQ